MNTFIRLALCGFLGCFPPLASAVPPPTINYQGYLTNPVGTPVNSSVAMTFRLYNAASGGTALYTETHPSVAVSNGNFNAVIGSSTPIPLPFDVPYWLTVAINADGEMTPRQPLASSPYAFRAASLDSAATIAASQITGAVTLANGSVGTAQLADGSVTAAKLAGNGCAAGQVLKFNGANWACASVGCVAGDLLPCYSGPAATLGVGVCKSGFRACDAMTGNFGMCVGQVLPSADVADGLDNDCDGGIDNVSGTAALTVARSGAGTGTVTSSPAGINCGADCAESYAFGAAVTLTAAPGGSSTFAGWSGGGCSGTGTCVTTITAATSVTATFTLNTFTLTVVRAGTGTGTVTSSPAGINCGADCSEVYDAGTMVTLTAAPGGSSTFAGWSGGGCSGTGTCVTTINAATSVTATFTLNTFTLTVTKAVGGTGTVTSSAGGINCGGDCSEVYFAGTTVTLTATPGGSSTFAGWSGGICAGTGTCTVTMNAATTVTATFTP